jgi:hypothetical protein
MDGASQVGQVRSLGLVELEGAGQCVGQFARDPRDAGLVLAVP